MRQSSRSVPLAVVAFAACASAGPASGARSAARADDLQDGKVLYSQAKYAEAEQRLRGVAGAEGRAFFAGAVARQGRGAEALPAAEEALAANPTHEVAVYALGRGLVEQQKWDLVIARMSGVIEKNQRVAYAYYWRAHGYQNTNQGARMLDDFQAFLGLAPDAPEATTVKQLLATFR
jgi:tetratricopeptide (TPR) repeat protein